MKKYLIINDMQIDNLTGVNANKDAVSMIDRVVKEVLESEFNYIFLMWTTLDKGYCVKDTDGWKYCAQIIDAVQHAAIFDKAMINCLEKGELGYDKWSSLIKDPDEIEIVGAFTDKSILADALNLKTLFPNAKVMVKKNCCAATTKENQEFLLKMLPTCGVEVV